VKDDARESLTRKGTRVEFGFGKERVIVNVPDKRGLFAEVRNRLRAGNGFALATINLDHLVKLGKSETFRCAYSKHDLVVADGNPVVWLSRLAGRGVKLVPGSEMLIPLSEIAVSEGVRIALVGSTEDSLVAAAAEMKRRVPGLIISAMIAPPMDFEPDGQGAEKVFSELEDSSARLVFLALGAPKQEVFAAHGRSRLPDVGFASIGAGLDFLAGTQVRAPAWVRVIAMEWAWRLIKSPRRLGLRYAKCFAILPRQATRALRMRFGE